MPYPSVLIKKTGYFVDNRMADRRPSGLKKIFMKTGEVSKVFDFTPD